MTRLLFITGSLRRDSFNTRLLDHLAARLDPTVSTDRLDRLAMTLPLFDQDIEDQSDIREAVLALHKRISGADGLVIASPEYNGQPSACLKNLVDWVSRLPHADPAFDNAFEGKPVLLCSASTGWSGGAVAIPAARALFGYVGGLVLGESVCVPHVDQAWSGAHLELDPFFDSVADGALARLIQLADNHARQRSQA